MRKQVQKERCTKIKLEKCPRVCYLYDKVQLAAARMLNADPSVIQIECNIPLSPDEIPADDLYLPSETYTTDFVIHFADGKVAVREAVFRLHLSRPSVAERLELSRRYWQQQGIDDWGIIIDRERLQNETK
ncbi:TnsA endonuclease N-terminal domain-containing protein [Gemmiger sp.]